MTDSPRPTVVVTGASSGIGREVARRLAARRHGVVLVARREERLRELADELEAAHGVRASVVVADLGEPDGPARVVQEIDALGLSVGGLVNAAGVGTAGPFAREDPALLARELAVDVVAPTILTNLLLPRLLEAPGGLLLNVSSTAGHQPVPNVATYAASKAYLSSLTASIWQETRGSGLTVVGLCPGPVATEFFEAAGSERFKVGTVSGIGPVVDAAFAAIDRRRGPLVTVGLGNRVQSFGSRLAPLRLTLAVAHRQTRRPGD